MGGLRPAAQVQACSTTGVKWHAGSINSEENQIMKQRVLQFSKLMGSCAGAACLLSACAWSVGGRHGDASIQPTRGQELVDLKKAKDAGAMTEEEYQAQRKRVLEK